MSKGLEKRRETRVFYRRAVREGRRKSGECRNGSALNSNEPRFSLIGHAKPYRALFKRRLTRLRETESLLPRPRLFSIIYIDL